MGSIYLRRGGFVSSDFLSDGRKYSSVFFTEIVLPRIEKKRKECRRKLQAIAAHLHIDNAGPHIFTISIERIEWLSFIEVPHSPYSLDIAPSDFFLFV
jgi:hypothetical protein